MNNKTTNNKNKQLPKKDTAPIAMSSSVCSLFYEPASRWLFCGLWGGEIQAFCKEPKEKKTKNNTKQQRAAGARSLEEKDFGRI